MDRHLSYNSLFFFIFQFFFHFSRYEINFDNLTGEEIVYEIAQKYYRGNITSASDKLLGDFRKGLLGYCSLEAPGMFEKMKEDRNNDRKNRDKMKEMKIAQELADQRSEYLSGRYNIGNKVYLDECGDPIIKTPKKIVSLDLNQGDYEGW